MGIFDSVSLPRVPRSLFKPNHTNKFTFNMGTIVPVLCKEVVPGDHWRFQMVTFIRFLALVAPILHKVNVKWELFFVPWRLIWANAPTFFTGGEDGLQAPAFPVFNIGNVAALGSGQAFLKDGSLLDYLGFPTMLPTDTYQAAYAGDNFGCGPIKAYQKVYDDWYRNETVEAGILPNAFLADGAIPVGDYAQLFTLRNCNWEKDYFTACVPSTQKGTEVTIPIASTITSSTTGDGGTNHAQWRNASTGAVLGGSGTGNVIGLGASSSINAVGNVPALNSFNASNNAYYDPNGTLVASNTSLTVNALRASITLQQFKEINMRGGSRYIEFVYNFFGVKSSDARLQRTELICSGRSPVTISEVLTTSTGTGTGQTPPGTLAGHGISVDGSEACEYFAEEHGFLLCNLRVVPRTAYQNGIPYEFTRQVQTDFLNPVFANLGEQSVRQFSVYYNMADAASKPNTGNVFGYISRFAEYKVALDEVHGIMKGAFSYWHVGRQFNSSSVPALNTNFVVCNPRTDIFAVTTDTHHIVAECIFDISVKRALPYNAIPAGFMPGFN